MLHLGIIVDGTLRTKSNIKASQRRSLFQNIKKMHMNVKQENILLFRMKSIDRDQRLPSLGKPRDAKTVILGTYFLSYAYTHDRFFKI